MTEIPPGTNTGITDAAPPMGGWIAGGETGIVREVLEPSAQFDLYLPDEESQFQGDFTNHGFDSSGCVTESGTNSVEAPLNRMRAKGLLPATHENFLKNNGYITFSNKVNFSDRFTAKMSGTTVLGNSLGNVGESIRSLHGLLPEGDWPWPNMSDLDGDANQDARRARYYAEIPQALQAKAKKFLDYFTINYDWILVGTPDNAKLRDYLKYGPIQIAAMVCSPWSSNEGMPPIPACGCGEGHATMLYGFQPDNSLKDFDSYKSFRKLLAADYCIRYAVQYTIKVKPLTAQSFHHTFSDPLAAGMPDSPGVRNLQRALQTVRRPDGSTYMTPGTFGPYGPQTTAAVKLFQEDNGIFGNGGINFGPQTMKAMNAKLNAM